MRTITTAMLMLSASAQAQLSPSTQGEAPAPGPSAATVPFDLSRIAPDRAVAVREATAGGEAEIAPNVLGGIEAGDLQRGATSVSDAVTPVYQRQAQISGKLAVRVGDHGLLFGRVGYAEFDLGEALPRSASRDFSAGGVLVGAGAEVRLSRSLSVRGEAHSVDYARNIADRQVLSGLAWHY